MAARRWRRHGPSPLPHIGHPQPTPLHPLSPPPSMVGAIPCGRPAPCPRPPPCPLPALSTPANRTIYFIRQHYQNMRGHHAQPSATASTSTHHPNPYPIPQHSSWQQPWLPSSSYSSPAISSST